MNTYLSSYVENVDIYTNEPYFYGKPSEKKRNMEFMVSLFTDLKYEVIDMKEPVTNPLGEAILQIMIDKINRRIDCINKNIKMV